MIFTAFILQASPAALSPEAFQAKCEEARKAKDWPGLEALARNQIAADAKDASAQSALGLALLAQNKGEDARAACERAIALDPKQVDAYLCLGLFYAQAKDRKAVIKTGRRLAAFMPSDIHKYYAVVPIFTAAGEDPSVPCLPSNDLPGILQSKMQQSPYWRDAILSGIHGSVAVDIKVGTDGVPISVTPLAGTLQLFPYVVNIAQHYQFKPQVRDGHPIAFRIPGYFVFQ